jgi:hypothetical protein
MGGQSRLKPPSSHLHATSMRQVCDKHTRSMRGACGMRSCLARIPLVFSSCSPLVLWWCLPRRREGSTECLLGFDCAGRAAIQMESHFPEPQQSKATADGQRWTWRGFRLNHGSWTAAGSAAPRHFRKPAGARKAVSPLRSATAVQIFVVRARSCMMVVQIRSILSRDLPWGESVHWQVTHREAKPDQSPARRIRVRLGSSVVLCRLLHSVICHLPASFLFGAARL